MKLVVILLYVPLWIVAQEYPRKEIDVNGVAEHLFGLPDMDLNYEDLYENLIQLITSPLNLNKAAPEDFRFLKMLTEAQVNSLIKYRTENGDFISVYELQAVPDFDLATIYDIIPFVTVNNQLSRIDVSLLQRIKNESDTYFLVRYGRTLETKNGFDSTVDRSSRFKGSPDQLYMRFRSSRPGDFSLGFTAEKDPGEQIKWSPSKAQYGPDYLSWHVQLQNKGRLKNFILGDYQTQFGQGLTYGGNSGMGKGSETITSIRRSNIGSIPYTSAYEAGAMRGIAATVKISDYIHVTGLFSNIKRDATVASNEETDIISAFQTNGFHRNEDELSRRKVIGEKNFGGVVQYERNSFSAGVMFCKTQFDVPVQRTRLAYNQFAFQGRENQNVGVFVNYSIQNVVFFSEVAHSLKHGFAGVAGVLTSLSSKFDLSLLYRRFDRNFYSFYASGFGENSNTQNESGIYWGWKYTFSRRYNVGAYVDFFKFPWLRFRSYGPTTGYEWLLRFSYEPSRKAKMSIHAREEYKSRNVQDDSARLYALADGKKNSYGILLDYAPHAKLRLKSRAQWSTYTINRKTTDGLALVHDVIVDFDKIKFIGRYAIFETDDYDNRQYVYENDVWLAYSMPAYFGSGVRKILIIEYKINKHFAIWFRFAHIRYRNQESIGSGLDRINGSTRNDIKAQFVVKL